MKKMALLLILAFGFLASTWADKWTITFIPSPMSSPYNFTSMVSMTGSVEVERNDNSWAYYYLIVRSFPLKMIGPDAKSISYKLYYYSNQNSRYEVTASDPYLAYNWIWNTDTTNFIVEVPASSPPLKPGTYTQNLAVDLYAGTHHYDWQTSGSIAISVVVPIQVGLGINPSTMLFGELVSGKPITSVVTATANTKYKMTFTSQNRGVLKLAGDTETVPYTLKIVSQVAGSVPQTLNLSATGTDTFISVYSGPTDLYNLTATIGTLGNPSNGTYSDVLTVSIANQ